nr:hypothetical protein CFP56_64934 [Quercus suber]
MVAGNQCPISKAQCEKLLAFINSGTTGTALGDAHHAANAGISCMATGVGGISGEGSGLVGSSSQSQVNTYPAFNPTLMSEFSDPFVTEVDASIPVIDPFVTPVSIPDAPIEPSFPCTSLVSPSHYSSTSSSSPTPPCVPLVTSDSIDIASESTSFYSGVVGLGSVNVYDWCMSPLRHLISLREP